MNLRRFRTTLAVGAELNFILTNRLPRRLATRFMGWFAKREQPLVRAFSIAAWKLFCDVDLSDASAQRFTSLHHAFTRELRPGARTVDPDPAVIASPCDAIVGACGVVEEGLMLQAKGCAYRLDDLLADAHRANAHRGCAYVTLRLTAGMYHRFHAPCDCAVDRVTHVAGDTWNVNPPALARVARLYCRNQRAILEMRTADGEALTLVPVAAILVAGIRLGFTDVVMNLGYRGPSTVDCSAVFHKGEEMGHFEHGSTIIVLGPPGASLAAAVRPGMRIRMGEALLRRDRGA